jgi:hypothetical protein
VAEIVEHPERFEYAATPWTYGPDVGRSASTADSPTARRFTWEGYELTVDWMPGQTEFACAIHGQIDGRLVVFTGDNLFADPDDPNQDGHEAVVARNSAIFEEGYIHAAEYLQRLQPDLIMGGHSFVMDRPQGLIDRYHRWSLAIREAYRELERRGGLPPHVRPVLGASRPVPGFAAAGRRRVTLHVRNFLIGRSDTGWRCRPRPGLQVEPAVLEGTTPAESIEPSQVPRDRRAEAAAGVRIVTFDATLDEHRYGPWFDMIVPTHLAAAGQLHFVRRTLNRPAVTLQHMRVDLRRPDVLVPQQFLHRADIAALLQ